MKLTRRTPGAITGLPHLREFAKVVGKAMDTDIGTDAARPWTRHIIKSIESLRPKDTRIVSWFEPWNKQNRYVLVCGHTVERGEYLVDLAWGLQHGGGDEGHGGILLALECEWGGSEQHLWEDFVKLADVRAERKVFVGVGNNGVYAGRLDLIDRFARFLARHHHARTDQILVALGGKYTRFKDQVTIALLGPRGGSKVLRNG